MIKSFGNYDLSLDLKHRKKILGFYKLWRRKKIAVIPKQSNTLLLLQITSFRIQSLKITQKMVVQEDIFLQS